MTGSGVALLWSRHVTTVLIYKLTYSSFGGVVGLWAGIVSFCVCSCDFVSA